MPITPTPRIHLLGLPNEAWTPRRGGLERYAMWLEGALREKGWLSAQGVSFGLRALAGGEVVRCGDGCSAAWAVAVGRHPLRDAWRIARERRRVLAARRVVALSPQVADELARFYGREDTIVLLNPVFARPGPRATVSTGRLLLVGHGFERRGLDRLLAALKVLPGLGLDVVGRDAHVPRWRAAVDAMGLATRVEFHGPVDAQPFLAGAAVLVHPARYEPWGNVVAEAVSVGLPVVASTQTGAAWLVHPDHRWSASEGSDGLAARIVAALTRPRDALWSSPSFDAHLAALAQACSPA
jgi:glycosyltransferase involved in cell wall biosynthesis